MGNRLCRNAAVNTDPTPAAATVPPPPPVDVEPPTTTDKVGLLASYADLVLLDVCVLWWNGGPSGTLKNTEQLLLWLHTRSPAGLAVFPQPVEILADGYVLGLVALGLFCEQQPDTMRTVYVAVSDVGCHAVVLALHREDGGRWSFVVFDPNCGVEQFRTPSLDAAILNMTPGYVALVSSLRSSPYFGGANLRGTCRADAPIRPEFEKTRLQPDAHIRVMREWQCGTMQLLTDGVCALIRAAVLIAAVEDGSPAAVHDPCAFLEDLLLQCPQHTYVTKRDDMRPMGRLAKTTERVIRATLAVTVIVTNATLYSRPVAGEKATHHLQRVVASRTETQANDDIWLSYTDDESMSLVVVRYNAELLPEVGQPLLPTQGAQVPPTAVARGILVAPGDRWCRVNASRDAMSEWLPCATNGANVCATNSIDELIQLLALRWWRTRNPFLAHSLLTTIVNWLFVQQPSYGRHILHHTVLSATSSDSDWADFVTPVRQDVDYRQPVRVRYAVYLEAGQCVLVSLRRSVSHSVFLCECLNPGPQGHTQKHNTIKRRIRSQLTGADKLRFSVCGVPGERIRAVCASAVYDAIVTVVAVLMLVLLESQSNDVRPAHLCPTDDGTPAPTAFVTLLQLAGAARCQRMLSRVMVTMMILTQPGFSPVLLDCD